MKKVFEHIGSVFAGIVIFFFVLFQVAAAISVPAVLLYILLQLAFLLSEMV